MLAPPSTELPAVEQPPVDPEVLVREARARQRRRRLRLAAVLLGLVAVGGIAYGFVGRDGTSRAGVEAVPHGPVVNLRAFSQHGRLAFVSRGSLWLLDGQGGTLRRVASPRPGASPTAPTFSADGKWLAYLEQPHAQLWISRADGSDAHVIRGLRVDSVFGWSPTRDLLAVATGPERTKQPCPCYTPTRLRLVSPDGAVRTLAHSSWFYGAAWSPDGRSIAASEISFAISKVVVYPASGGHGTTWLAITAHQRLDGMNGIPLQLAGWWPHLGIGVWAFGAGAIRNLDATPLDLIARRGAKPRLLGRTLSDGTTDAVAASANGEVAIVTDHGGGRAAWQDKQVDLCGTASCQPLPRSPRTVTVDPAWSSNGDTLDYVEAPNVLVGPWTQKRIAAWYAAHRLLLYNTRTRRTQSVPTADGATAINWATNDRSLLYVRDDAIWLLPTLTGQPIRIATPLYPPNRWPQYYAQIDWSGRFAWTTR
jgi:WD40-like Beta Propeller Repeat